MNRTSTKEFSDIKTKAEAVVDELTMDEKAGLCSGADFWHLKSVERLGLSQIMVTDGPHGLRKQAGESDHIGLNESVEATCFPTASATANSWDVNLMYEVGQALAEECLQEDVSVILGPGANIKRSPLCGRNFEYISEDPHLTGEIASALVNGIQSKNIGTSLKHYVMNNQESRRMTTNVVVDERAQREIYLRGFEKTVKKSRPWTVMCSYNMVDGTYLSDHKRLLNDILRDEWGFEGLVMTDWGASNNRVAGVKAGLDLEMPYSGEKTKEQIVTAVENGKLSVVDLNKAVIRVVELILKSQEARVSNFTYDKQVHHKLAQKAAAHSAVLLKNEKILPLEKGKKIAVIGEFAENPRYQGAGSSFINPYRLDTVCEQFGGRGVSYTYSRGYDVKKSSPNPAMINEAVEAAKSADVAVIFAGLTDDYESEGFDRRALDIPESHNRLITAVAEVNPETVVVLQNGAPVTMPWLNEVKGVLDCYLSGQAGSAAAVDVLFGDVNPSGKLAETFPLSLESNPSYKQFPGFSRSVEYRESIYVGYRYYDTAHKEVLFPFGFGLSYTDFVYSDLAVERRGDYDFVVSLSVTNTGKADGAEIVQLYVANNQSPIFKADKELRAFEKIFLKTGETKQVSFSLDRTAFAYYNVAITDWHIDSGDYRILVGSSSRDIKLQESVPLNISDGVIIPDYRESAPAYYNLENDVLDIDEEQFRMLYGRDLPERERPDSAPFDELSTMDEINGKWIGRKLNGMIGKQLSKMTGIEGDEESPQENMLAAVLKEMPLRSMTLFGGDKLPKYFVEGLVELLNGHLFKGLGYMLRRK